MNSTFTKKLLDLETLDQVKRAISERRAEILRGIEAGTVKPSVELMDELRELNVAIGDVEVGNE